MLDKSNNVHRRSKNELIEDYLLEKYEFRFNTIKSKSEFKPKGSSSFQSVTRFDLNSFKRELNSEIGVCTSAENIRAILESDFSPKVNPVHEYFNGLEVLDPDINNYTVSLANTVSVSNSGKWIEYLVKWLVAVVANALNDEGCRNHTCLVLTGEQGKFKTTWLDHLCPKSLQSYLFTGKIDPQNKDTQTLIAEYLFINIDDQLKALNKRDENELKNLITTPAVKYRRPYDINIIDYPHLASFMASVNGNDFLTDPTGSRRFLPFEVVSIDIEKTKRIDMDKVYSEIMWLYKNGFRYWFNGDEIEELHINSQSFHVQTVEYELLVQGFEKPCETDKDSFMTTAEILTYLKSCLNIQLIEKKMGEALKKAGFERIPKRNGGSYPVYGYRIKKVEPNPFFNTNM